MIIHSFFWIHQFSILDSFFCILNSVGVALPQAILSPEFLGIISPILLKFALCCRF